ncbi:MAG TPA: complex I NDUFA9 subunit family protein [Pusillimonas sp.]|uniref:complex I NDUFA9 subunit family protein n=1 Tax=Pusillimonas sp. TaxID=3040095 RepID=UPI002CE7EEAE|nr:complex I NDUFA9 subunit family protein [Pusillimonas sp.]HUH87590.1 complex I NDUFA9 subunit family protein [Pusillimonas sp.]
MRVLVIGGTGFIGQHLVACLVRLGHSVHVPTRRYQNGRDLLVFPPLTLFEANVHDDTELEQLLSEVDAVVNLVGVLHSRPGKPYGPEFERAHVQLPRRIAACCRKTGVRRFLHVSALGADPDGPSAYLRSKAAGEAAIRAEFASYPEGAYTIFRPSVVFGREDNFMNLFARLAKWLPVIPLAGAKARMQPVYVRDVAAAIAKALPNSATYGKTYTLAGVSQYTLAELVRLAARWSGRPRPVWPVPRFVGYLQAWLFELLPGRPLMSRDNLNSLRVDNVSEVAMDAELGVNPTPLESIAPSYLRGGRADRWPVY